MEPETHVNNASSSTPPEHEAENQAMLEAYGATEITVVRDQDGKIWNAVATFPDGETEILYHASLSSSRPNGPKPAAGRARGAPGAT